MSEKSPEPRIFSVGREARSWQFSRRDFITLAGAATAGAALACGRSKDDEALSDTEMRETNTAATVVAGFSMDQASPTAVPVEAPVGEELAQRLEACQDILAHDSNIWWVDISGDSRALLTSPSEGGDKVWHLPGGELGFSLTEDYRATFAPHQSIMLLDLGTGRVEIYDTRDLSRLGTLTGDPLGTFSPDGSLFALAENNAITIYGLPSREVVSSFTVPDTPETLAISPNLSLAAVGLASGQIVVFSLPDGAELVTLDAHDAPVRQVYIGLGGIRMASFDDDNPVIKFWSLPDGEMISQADTGEGMIWFGEMLAGDQMLLTWHEDLNSKRLWRFADGTMARAYVEDEDLLFNPNGNTLIATSGGDPLAVVSLPGMEESLSIDNPTGATLWPAAMSPDETIIALAVDDVTVELIEVSSGGIISVIDDFSSPVDVIAFSGDGSLLITAHENGAVRVYSAAGEFVSCLVDIEGVAEDVELNQYTTTTETGETITYTLPCGAPIPAGAVCVCNCVGGGGGFGCSCVGYVSCSCVGYVSCSCVGDICSCVSHVSGGGSHYWFPN